MRAKVEKSSKTCKARGMNSGDAQLIKILIVDDEAGVRELLKDALKLAGFETQVANDGMSALTALRSYAPDIMIIDINMPLMDGFELVERLRKNGNDVPVLMLSARADRVDITRGLTIGADDYVVKPFSVRELAARVRAISRRRVVEAPSEMGQVSLDRNRRSVHVLGELIDLTAKEFDLLAVLLEEPGRVVPRQELYSRVWDPIWIGSGKTLDVHVAGLRKKLGNPDLIETVRGVGYRYVDLP